MNPDPERLSNHRPVLATNEARDARPDICPLRPHIRAFGRHRRFAIIYVPFFASPA
jgi:hypothetical protein